MQREELDRQNLQKRDGTDAEAQVGLVEALAAFHERERRRDGRDDKGQHYRNERGRDPQRQDNQKNNDQRNRDDRRNNDRSQNNDKSARTGLCHTCSQPGHWS